MVKKANARLELLRRSINFNASTEDLKTIYTTFVRSILENSCTVWHSCLTKENREDIERVQKTACKLILKNEFKDYENALMVLDLESSDKRREHLHMYKFCKKVFDQ